MGSGMGQDVGWDGTGCGTGQDRKGKDGTGCGVGDGAGRDGTIWDGM